MRTMKRLIWMALLNVHSSKSMVSRGQYYMSRLKTLLWHSFERETKMLLQHVRLLIDSLYMELSI